MKNKTKFTAILMAMLMLLPLTGCVDDPAEKERETENQSIACNDENEAGEEDAISEPKTEPDQTVPETQPEESESETPAKTIPDDLPATEKPVIYLYPGAEEDNCDEQVDAKPVVYLIPENARDVTVKLDYRGRLTSTYPAYEDGWHVRAYPDGTLVDPETGREYYCLFWEGVNDVEYDFSRGFCIRGEDTAVFLEESLARLGLNEREANEFIIYWLPRMETNPYNLIAFQSDVYTENAVLTVTPEPDTVIRVFMAWQKREEPISLAPQELHAPERVGFTVVEWGGTEVTN